MLKIWGRKSSSNVQAILWCLGELNLEYKRIDAGFIYGQVNTPEYLSMNPNGTVPTLQDADNPPLWESCAILRYLANQYAHDEFWPTEAITNANVDKWAEWSKINVAMKFTSPVFWKVVRTPPSKQDPVAINNALHTFNKVLEIAEVQLSRNEFIAGDNFTLADIQFGHCLYRYFDINIERQKHTCIRGYYDSLTERKAFREHVMISYEELRVTD